jgi:MFS family permease
MSGKLDWRWIGIGVAIMFGLNIVASLIIAALIGGDVPETATTPEEAAAAIGGGRLLLGAVISILSFAIGGYIVGLKSPGRTILEPGISAAIAVVIGLVISGALTPANMLVGGLIPFLAGLAGGYLGERQQSSRAVGRS